jgi:hypothetical protein
MPMSDAAGLREDPLDVVGRALDLEHVGVRRVSS